MKTKIMKKLFIIILLAPLVSFGQDITTYYLIRHAEKNITDLTNKNPHLTEKENRERLVGSLFLKIYNSIKYIPLIFIVLLKLLDLLLWKEEFQLKNMTLSNYIMMLLKSEIQERQS